MTIRISKLGGAEDIGTVYDLEIEVCGETYFIRREHKLMRRLEQIAGPLRKLGERLDAGDVTQAELGRIYQALLDGEKVVPSFAAIEAWLFETGTPVAAKAIALDVLSLTAGNKVLRVLTEAERRAAPQPFGEAPEAPETPEEAERTRPFSSAAALTGAV